jgi:ATP-dependent DNA helicase RecG
MFDRDLQDVIIKENEAFIARALERASVARKEKPKLVTLSPLENAFTTAKTRDLSNEALEQYRAIAKITDEVGAPEFNSRLSQQGLLKDENGLLVPTGFGVLLFGSEPRAIMPQSGLLGTLHYSSGNEELKDFDGPQVLAPSQALKWLRDKMPNQIERTGARRGETNDAFFELVREGIVNALVHRDYEINGAKCQLIVTQDIVTVKSPGKPPLPITLEQMQTFTAPMLSRNPVLHYVFAKMELAEERGLGLKSMRDRAHRSGLPLPKYSWEDPYLVLKLYSTPTAALTDLGDEILSVLSPAERSGWEWLVNQETTTSGSYSHEMQVPDRTALNHLKHFSDLGLVMKTGAGPATRYKINRP